MRQVPDKIFTTRHNKIMVVTMNRPEVHNCIDDEAARQMNTVFDELERDDDVHVVVLTGAGSESFSSGVDLKLLAAEGPDFIPKVIFEDTGWAGIGKRFFPKPLIAAVNGYALAGGLELALSCDFIIASDSATLGFNEVTLGPIADAGGCFRLPRWVPLPLAREMIMTGKPLNAERAFEVGLVNHVVPQSKLMDTTLSIAESIADNSTVSMRIMKKLMYETGNQPESEAWEINDRYMRESMQTEAFNEGPRAFVARRRPKFSGN